MSGEPPKVLGITGGDDGAPSEVTDGNHERINGQLGAGSASAQQVTAPDSDPTVDRVNLDALAPESAEDSRVLGAATDDLGQHRGDGGNREFPPAHLRDQGSHTIAPFRRAVGDGGNRLAVEQQHRSAGPSAAARGRL